MFIQIIQGMCRDADTLHRQTRHVAPGARAQGGGLARRDVRRHRRQPVHRRGAVRVEGGRSPQLDPPRAGRVVGGDREVLRRRGDLPRLRRGDDVPRRRRRRRRIRPGHPGPGGRSRAVPPVLGAATHGHAAAGPARDHRGHHRDGAGRPVHPDGRLPQRGRCPRRRAQGDAGGDAPDDGGGDGPDEGRDLSGPASPLVRQHRSAASRRPAVSTVSGRRRLPVGPISISVFICGQTPQSKHGVHRQSSTSTSSSASCQSCHSQSLSSPESRWSQGSTSFCSRSRVVYQATSTGSSARAVSAQRIQRS